MLPLLAALVCLIASPAILAQHQTDAWIFEVRVHSYRNPNNFAIENINKGFDCCDIVNTNDRSGSNSGPDNGGCSWPCDNYFEFCLQRSTDDPDDCYYDQVNTPTVYSSSTVTFEPPIILSATGDHWTMEKIQLRATVYDSDDANVVTPDDIADDTIGNVVIQFTAIDILASENFSIVKQYSLEAATQAIINVSYRLLCNSNYYGGDCSVFCEARDDTSGHYTCDTQGNIVCNNGYIGTNTNCTTPLCDPVCSSNAVCIEPNTCQCIAGWTGDDCTIPVCDTPCNSGTCVSPNTCQCNNGYTGLYCTVPVCDTPCNNGTCVSPNSCQCNSGYTGMYCTVPVCDPPCTASSTCIAHNACQCIAGWTGDDCTIPVCDTPCNNGTCVSPNTCQCNSGYTGLYCTVPVCDTPCNNGTCISPDTCQCSTGYTGMYCAKPVCDTPCNNGTCVSPNTCQCSTGYTGMYCSTIESTNNSSPGDSLNGVQHLLIGCVSGILSLLLIISLATIISIALIMRRRQKLRQIRQLDDKMRRELQDNPFYTSYRSMKSANSCVSAAEKGEPPYENRQFILTEDNVAYKTSIYGGSSSQMCEVSQSTSQQSHKRNNPAAHELQRSNLYMTQTSSSTSGSVIHGHTDNDNSSLEADYAPLSWIVPKNQVQ